MLTYALHRLPDGPLTVVLSGDLTERSVAALRNLRRELAPTLGKQALAFDCRGIENVNSIGSLGWMAFVADLALATPYEMQEMTVTLVTYANMLPDFTKGATVVSFYAPFHCASCAKLFEVRVLAAEFLALGDYPPAACPRCHGAVTPEVEAADFGRFLLPARPVASGQG